MRVIRLVAIGLMAAGVALGSGVGAVSAKAVKLPPGACAFGKGGIQNGAICSYQCNPTTMWCSQQMCINGQLTQLIYCYGGFCSPKCG